MVDDYPSRRWIWFGDGAWCQEVWKKPKQSEDGVDGWEFVINPSERVIRQYKLKIGEQLDANGFIKKWYPDTVVRILDDSVSSGRIFIKTTFDGSPTNISNEVAYYTTQIEGQKKHIKILKAENAKVYEMFKKATSKQLAHISDAARMINKAREAAKKEPSDEDETKEKSRES